MLKKSLFSPTRPRRAETRLSPGFVLASFSGSTYQSVCLASSLAAALLDGLFEHPVYYSGTITALHRTKNEFLSILLACQRHNQRFGFLSGPAIRFQRVFQRVDVFGRVEVHRAVNDLRNVGEPDAPV